MRKGLLAVAFLVALPSLSSAAIPERATPDTGSLIATQHQLSADIQADPLDGDIVLAAAKKKGKVLPPPPPRRRPKVSPHK